MSTFDGFVKEFPRIRSESHPRSDLRMPCFVAVSSDLLLCLVDYFRQKLSHHRPPPLACFLSHVHSDHLQGLEAFRAPFIYCSAATRAILLRLERAPARLNFAKGIIETRIVHYKHLKSLLKPVPLNTRTVIELSPGLELRVTLLDANHCPGSVMFLIEDACNAILYTGDVRAETWWVNSLIRNPSVISFTSGLRRLDKVYLDTTFATKSDIYRTFPSKADGVRELLERISRYPKDTDFYFHSWTFGYEQAWITLTAFLESKMHVDDYKLGLYESLTHSAGALHIDEAAALCGFRLGNTYHPGCLTNDKDTRLHACERGHGCPAPYKKDVVHIIPVVSRLPDGREIEEEGAGGGFGDLGPNPQLEVLNNVDFDQLVALCNEVADSEQRSRLLAAIRPSQETGLRLTLQDSHTYDHSDQQLQLKYLPDMILAGQDDLPAAPPAIVGSAPDTSSEDQNLPIVIRFPYSRHSSYGELCEFLEAFKPKDIYPCTVDVRNWHPDVSMQTLFGHLCSETVFAHDKEMLAAYEGPESRRADFEANAEPNFVSPSRSHTEESTVSQQAPIAQTAQVARDYTHKDEKIAAIATSEQNDELRPQKKARHEGRRAVPAARIAEISQTSADSDGVPRMPSRSPQPYHSPYQERANKEPLSPLPSHDRSAEPRDEADKEASQTSLQDSAFGSQNSLQGPDGTAKLERRREAYKAAKGRTHGGWAEFSTMEALGKPEMRQLDDE